MEPNDSRNIVLKIEDPIYFKLVKFINDPIHIRKGPNERVRTRELTNAFNTATNEQITYKNKLPQLMRKFMEEYPNLVNKQVKHDGTIYFGIGLTSDPLPKVKMPALTSKQKNDKRVSQNKLVLDNIQNSICQRANWTVPEYQQMINLNLIYIVMDDDIPNIDSMIYIAIGRLIEYTYIKINKLKKVTKYAEIVKIDFEKSIQSDNVLSYHAEYPVYTNRLAATERTYEAGNRLDAAITKFINPIHILPQFEHIKYPDIKYLYGLVLWLKTNSACKTRIDMRNTQENFDENEVHTWDVEELLDDHSGTLIST